jgi:ring-1,2-phenylacetyl-CoA epoxidase subunit PaaE
VPRFHDLTVTAIEKTIRDAVVVTLRPPEGADFTFRPGQYLTFRRDFDGQEIRRTYSICSGLDDGVLQVGIKRVDGGAFSTFANEDSPSATCFRSCRPRAASPSISTRRRRTITSPSPAARASRRSCR